MLLAIRWLDIARLIVIGFAINAIKVDGKSLVAEEGEQVRCGKRYFGDHKKLQRTTILNGKRADKGEYPWQVLTFFLSLKKFGRGGTVFTEGGKYLVLKWIFISDLFHLAIINNLNKAQRPMIRPNGIKKA